jgi:hypothetical protein
MLCAVNSGLSSQLGRINQFHTIQHAHSKQAIQANEDPSFFSELVRGSSDGFSPQQPAFIDQDEQKK